MSCRIFMRSEESFGSMPMAEMSPPAQKALPSPVSTTARLSVDRASSHSTCSSCSRKAGDSALRRSGSLKVRTAMPPSVRVRSIRVGVASVICISIKMRRPEPPLPFVLFSSGNLLWHRASDPQHLIKHERCQSRGGNAAQREVADHDGKVACAENERDADRKEVAWVGKVDLVHHPDARHRRCDEAEDGERQTGQHRWRNGLQECTELGRKTKQDGDYGCDDEDQRRIDLGHGHDADIFRVSGDAGT